MSRKRLLSVGFLVFHHCCIENLGLRGFVLEKYMQVLNLNKRITDKRSKLLSADILLAHYFWFCLWVLTKGNGGSRLAAFIAKAFLYSLQNVFLARNFFPYSFEGGMLSLWTKGQEGLVLAKNKKNITHCRKYFLREFLFLFFWGKNAVTLDKRARRPRFSHNAPCLVFRHL